MIPARLRIEQFRPAARLPGCLLAGWSLAPPGWPAI